MPGSASGYGSTPQLLKETADVFERYLGQPTAESTLAAGFCGTSWISDRMMRPPTLLVTAQGMDPGQGMDLVVRTFRILGCVSRRSLLLANVSRSTIRDLPMYLWPTLLVNQPDLSPRILALWHASNYDGIFIPGDRGSVSHVASAKVLHLAFEPPGDPWCDSALRLVLSPPQYRLPPLGAVELAEIADRFQSRWLRFRLENVLGVIESQQTPSGLNLPACIEQELEFANAVGPLIERHRQDTLAKLARDVSRVIVQVIWVPSHKEQKISVGEITKLANTCLRERGETLEYSSEEIGWKLRDLGFYRPRNGSGKYLKFSRDTRARVHKLAQTFQLDLQAVSGCPDCTRPDVIVPKEVM